MTTTVGSVIVQLRGLSLLAFTGAGLSTAAGIPDYRGPNGVWTTNPGASKLSRVNQYRDDPELRRRLWQDRLNNPLYLAQPTPGHHHLQSLAMASRLIGVVTQNVDGLHRLPHRNYPLVELHGSIHEARCLGCGATLPMNHVLARVRQGETDPRCQERRSLKTCGGILTSNTVTFGEPVPPERITLAQDLIHKAQAVLVLGSTLSVNPAARLVAFALDAGRIVVVVNQGPTRYDDRGVIKVYTDCQAFLTMLSSDGFNTSMLVH